MFCDMRFLILTLQFVMYAMQGHSTAASLPPLPENGETEETQALVVDPKGDQSPIPSATNSHVEEVEEEAAEEVQSEDKATSDQEVDTAPPKRRRLAKKALSAVSSPAKEQGLEDDEESGSPPVFQATPLRACSTSSTLSLQSSGAPAFGGPIFGNSEDEEDEEHRYVFFEYDMKMFVLSHFCADHPFVLLCCSQC